MDNFIGQIFQQNCGDSLRVIKKSEEKRNNKVLYECEFINYPYKTLARIDSIKGGQVYNYALDECFLKKEWPQNCGDTLVIIEKTDKKEQSNYLFRCKFLKYPCEILAKKTSIINGKCVNPQIEVVEFIQKEWPQHCGDIIKIIKKTDKKGNNNEVLFECEFIKYPYKFLMDKGHIIRGVVNNPQIEQVEFIDKIWPQNCGDSLRIIKKSNKIRRDNKGKFLYECEFIKYPCKVLAEKACILKGEVKNWLLPEYSYENLKKYIERNFGLGNRVVTLTELAQSLNLSECFIGHKINEFKLRNKINYSLNKTETDIKIFIENLNINVEQSNNKILKNQEIDIYIPELKIGFEYNGNYWHSNLYKESNYHQNKTLKAKSKGISLIHIFEFEWLNKQTICKSLIKAKLGLFDKKVGARQCEIRELKNQEYQNFCNKNHLQGEAGARVKLGLYYKDELIQIMSFGSPRFTSEYEWEIIRECSKLGYFIIGGKQRLWNYFIKKYHPNNCISYCDFSKFTGESYIKLGFKQLRLNKPGFWWYDEENKEVYWRNPVKHKEMVEAGYLKIYDCGQLVFSWNKV